MSDLTPDVGSTLALSKPDLQKLFDSLRKLGYETLGPHIEDGAIAYGPIQTIEDLPRGYTSQQEAGRYQVVYTGHGRDFDITPGAQSWKQYLFPPRSTLFSVDKSDGAWHIKEEAQPITSYAFVGVRPCELAAILIQDRVFLRDEWSDPIYRARRQSSFILAVNCLHPCGTCFCASMGTGPKAETGYDLNLTELDDVYLVSVGSEAGKMVMTGLSVHPASAFLLQTANKGFEDAKKRMARTLPNVEEIPDLLLSNLEHPQWDNVAKRCLSCANCTQVCPTCFCWEMTDQPSLAGDHSVRARTWDSCFNPDYSYIVGGNSRPNTRSRYRQWLTHKMASWKHQFDVLGCVGCGRCITWCPAGIDLTEEIAAIRKEIAA